MSCSTPVHSLYRLNVPSHNRRRSAGLAMGYTKQEILCHHAGVQLSAHHKKKERGVYASSKRTGSITRCAGSGRPTKIMNAVKEIVESEMRADTSIILLALQPYIGEW